MVRGRFFGEAGIIFIMQTKWNPAETGRLADQVYREKIKSRIAPEDRYKFMVLDVETGDYEIDTDEEAASQRMEARRPFGRLILMRANGGAAYHMGTKITEG